MIVKLQGEGNCKMGVLGEQQKVRLRELLRAEEHKQGNERLTYAQIGQMFGISSSTVQKYRRRMMREQLYKWAE
jgi:DNA-directed RNA polymerase specialized sigma24 family protein